MSSIKTALHFPLQAKPAAPPPIQFPFAWMHKMSGIVRVRTCSYSYKQMHQYSVDKDIVVVIPPDISGISTLKPFDHDSADTDDNEAWRCRVAAGSQIHLDIGPYAG